MTETLEQTCRRLEHFETPEWAARAILEKEIMTPSIIDPCAGSGIMSHVALEDGYDVHCNDIHAWGQSEKTPILYDYCEDFLNASPELRECVREQTIFMNPPFSLAEQFVAKSFEYGARKIVCFQRFAWWESKKRRAFWQHFPPARVWICGDRADCWRHDIPQDQRGSGTPTAHAWFVWERGAPAGTLLGHIYKGDAP